jgi:phytanoyl-CoA hydroxylase
MLLDQLLGSGRVLFQEMALVKPARIGSEKPWHQDAAYFRVTDPGLIIGVWIALDPATRSNGCMEVGAGSQLHGAQPHRHENDLNRCRLQPQSIHTSALQLEMQPGDALLFHPLLHHRTAANTSQLRRRALQFHYHQLGAVWGDIADHRRLFHDEKGNYAGCTRLHESLTAAGVYTYRGPLARTIVLQDEMAG